MNTPRPSIVPFHQPLKQSETVLQPRNQIALNHTHTASHRVGPISAHIREYQSFVFTAAAERVQTEGGAAATYRVQYSACPSNLSTFDTLRSQLHTQSARASQCFVAFSHFALRPRARVTHKKFHSVLQPVQFSVNGFFGGILVSAQNCLAIVLRAAAVTRLLPC